MKRYLRDLDAEEDALIATRESMQRLREADVALQRSVEESCARLRNEVGAMLLLSEDR